MILLKPRVDTRHQNSQKVSPSISENKCENLDLSELDHSVSLKPTKGGSGRSSRSGSAGRNLDDVHSIEHDDLDMPAISIHDVGRRNSGARTVKVSNFTPRNDVLDALGKSEHGTLGTVGQRKHSLKTKNSGGNGSNTRAQSGKETNSSTSNDVWIEARRKAKQPRRASEAHKMTSTGGENDRSHSPNVASSEHGVSTSRERGLGLTRGESNKSLLARTPSGRGLGGSGLTAGGGGGGGGMTLQRGLSEKGGGLENRKNGSTEPMGIKKQASEKLTITSNTTSNGKFPPSSLTNERRPSAKFPLERQASVNMGNSTSGKSNPADIRLPSGNLSMPSTARGLSSNSLLAGFGNGGDMVASTSGAPSGVGPNMPSMSRVPSLSRASSTKMSVAIPSRPLGQEAEALIKRSTTYPKGKTIQEIRDVNPTKLKFVGLGLGPGAGPTLVSQHILLGGRDDSQNGDLLYKLGVTHILNCARQLPYALENSKKHKFVYMKIPLMDDEHEDITAVMDTAQAFIKRVEDVKGRVLVHCIAGASRSVTIVMMYFMLQHQFDLRHIYEYIKASRPQIAVNDGFKLQMAKLELTLFGATSVASDLCGADWKFYAWRSIKHEYLQMAEPSKACCVPS